MANLEELLRARLVNVNMLLDIRKRTQKKYDRAVGNPMRETLRNIKDIEKQTKNRDV